jgi:hypothetical protein
MALRCSPSPNTRCNYNALRVSSLAQQVWQFSNIRRNPSRLILRDADYVPGGLVVGCPLGCGFA